MFQRPLCMVLQGSGTAAHPGEPSCCRCLERLPAIGSGCPAAVSQGPRALPGAHGAAGSHQQPHAVAPHAGRSKGVRWPPEPQGPAAGRLLLLNDGVLFNTPFPGSVTRPRDEGTVLCNDLGTSPLFTEHRCPDIPLFPLWKGTSQSCTDPIFSLFPFSLSPSFQCRKICSHA